MGIFIYIVYDSEIYVTLKEMPLYYDHQRFFGKSLLKSYHGFNEEHVFSIFWSNLAAYPTYTYPTTKSCK